MTKQLTPLRRKDQATGYQAAVKDIVAWLEFHAHYEAVRVINDKFGKG